MIEDYRYVRRDGRWRPEVEHPAGVGTISVPTSIDDDASLAKPGRLDVRSLQIIGADRSPILGSFMSFHNHGRTDLADIVTNGGGGFDSIELEAPAGVGRPERQAADRGLERSHHLSRYRIDQPARHPIEIMIGVVEGEPPHDELTHGRYFLIDVVLHIPDIGLQAPPRLESIEFGWPNLTETDTSMRIWSIERPDLPGRLGFNITRFLTPLRTDYDTTRQTITCSAPAELDRWFRQRDHRAGHEVTYVSSVLVEARRPVQLVDRSSIDVRVLVGLDALLSGTEIRLHDATGYRNDSTPLETASLLRAAIEVNLEEATAFRLTEQRNSLHFRGVQPSLDVIDTIAATIASCGYHVDVTDDGHGFDRTITATRVVGGTTVQFDVTVQGHHRTVRRTLKDGGGPRLREELDAGDVDVEVVGFTSGDHRRLTVEMNALHASLRQQLSALVEV
ncbi:MAG: hypothetical protein AAGA93_17835 [Actinomycetota bacterium]